jgi:hypothetical protein
VIGRRHLHVMILLCWQHLRPFGQFNVFFIIIKRAHWLMVFIMCCIWMTKFSNHNPIIDDKSIDNPYSMEVWVGYTLKRPLLKLRFIGWWHSHKEIHYFWLASLKQKISLRFWSLKSWVLFLWWCPRTMKFFTGPYGKGNWKSGLPCILYDHNST